MAKSIISNERSCLVCGTSLNLHRHHIYGGAGRRNQSEKFGCWCYLCARHHNMSDAGIHSNPALNIKIKRMCQEILENEHGWSRAKFIEIFGRNYRD